MRRTNESSIVSKCALAMDVISQARQPLPFSEIVARTGFVKSSCHRILGVLQGEQMISYDKQSRTYFTGPRLRHWARSSLPQPDIADLAGPAMEALGASARMNTALSILDDQFVLYIRTTNHIPIRFSARAGDRAPLHSTAAGKVFLAHMSATRRADVLAGQKLDAFTEFTLTDIAAIEAQLPDVLQRGYALAIREEYLHVIGMAAPIWNAQGQVTACLSLWTLTDDTTQRDLERCGPGLLRTASDISALAGGEARWPAAPERTPL